MLLVKVFGGPLQILSVELGVRVAYGILVPQPGFKLIPPAVEVWSLNHWTTREVPVN